MAAKIESLTPEQEIALKNWHNRYLQWGLSTAPADRGRAERAMADAYRRIGRDPVPVIWVDSPLTASILMHAMRHGASLRASLGNSLRASLEESLRDSLWASLRASLRASLGNSLRTSLRASLQDSLGASLRDSLGASLQDSLGASLRDSLRDSLQDSLGASLRDSLRDSLQDSLWDSLRASLRASLQDSKISPQTTYWWGQMDLYWVSYYRYCDEVLGVPYASNAHDGLRIMADIGQSCGWWYPRDGVCIACERPEILHMADDPKRLHCADGPAIRFRDGWSLYYWHGVPVPEKLILHPEEYTREDYLREENAEVRRAAQEILGSRFAQLLDLVEIDRRKVGTGVHAKEATLLRTRVPDEVAQRHIQYVNVMCHSTEREYMLCVPETIADAWEAVAWTFGKTREEYDPVMEA